jgi:hypothetical protein
MGALRATAKAVREQMEITEASRFMIDRHKWGSIIF